MKFWLIYKVGIGIWINIHGCHLSMHKELGIIFYIYLHCKSYIQVYMHVHFLSYLNTFCLELTNSSAVLLGVTSDWHLLWLCDLWCGLKCTILTSESLTSESLASEAAPSRSSRWSSVAKGAFFKLGVERLDFKPDRLNLAQTFS